MIIVFLVWVLVFTICMVIGYSFFQFVHRVQKGAFDKDFSSLDRCFFAGFAILSALSGILSIFFPVGIKFLCLVVISVIALCVLNYKGISALIKGSFSKLTKIKKEEVAFFFLILLFVLMGAVQKITWLDTQAYHAQNIQWIQKYAVVPGLGNLHDRFAFNSMFFVASALFTFHIKDVLIFPLNGICYIVLVARLFTLYKKEDIMGMYWKAMTYVLAVIISFFIMLPNINTPSPDIICATIIIYIFLIILENKDQEGKKDLSLFVFITLLVFTCIVYKLSSLFLSLVLLFFMSDRLVRKILIILGISALILIPFLVRNYILSGYLIYPFPELDIFNPDWKIPVKNVVETKSVIEAWARIPVRPYSEVLSLKITQWIVPWFTQLSANSKLIVLVNFFSIFTMIWMLIRKEFKLVKIQVIIIINLIFWFLEAPDPRFAYGFIFIGFSITLGFLIKSLPLPDFIRQPRSGNLLLALFLVIIFAKRIMVPAAIVNNPSMLLVPLPFGTVETKNYSSNFIYRIPEHNQECFNTDIPCVVYPLSDVVMRGENLASGFKVVNKKKE